VRFVYTCSGVLGRCTSGTDVLRRGPAAGRDQGARARAAARAQVRHGSLRCLEALLVAAARAPDAGGLADEANAPLLAFLSSLLLKVGALRAPACACQWCPVS
jgi:hypothetical protein